jgi:hypothetical protein
LQRHHHVVVHLGRGANQTTNLKRLDVLHLLAVVAGPFPLPPRRSASSAAGRVRRPTGPVELANVSLQAG